MESTQAIDGAPGSITLGGKSFLVGQPSLMDMGTLFAHLKKRIKTPVEDLQQNPAWLVLDPADQQAELKRVAKEYLANKQQHDAAAILEALNTVEGVRFATWLCLRKVQPVTFEQVCEWITEANYPQVWAEVSPASGMDDLGNLAGLPGS